MHAADRPVILGCSAQQGHAAVVTVVNAMAHCGSAASGAKCTACRARELPKCRLHRVHVCWYFVRSAGSCLEFGARQHVTESQKTSLGCLFDAVVLHTSVQSAAWRVSDARSSLGTR